MVFNKPLSSDGRLIIRLSHATSQYYPLIYSYVSQVVSSHQVCWLEFCVISCQFHAFYMLPIQASAIIWYLSLLVSACLLKIYHKVILCSWLCTYIEEMIPYARYVLMAVTVSSALFWKVWRVAWYIFIRILEKSATYVIKIVGPSSALNTNRAFLHNVGKHIPDDTPLAFLKYSKIKRN
jgi:hypothetical protein